MSILTYCFSTVNDLCQNSMFCRSYTVRVILPTSNKYLQINNKNLTPHDEESHFSYYSRKIYQHHHNKLDHSRQKYYNEDLIRIAIGNSEREPTLLDYIEYVCITWFTFEFWVKFFVSPNKVDFFKTVTNWIDILCFFWFYIDLLYNYTIFRQSVDTHPAWDLFGTVRIMRLFKLFNHFPGLKIILASLRASAGILRLLLLFLCVAVIIFASLIYYAEKLAAGSDGRNGMSSIVGSGSLYSNHLDHENQFTSIIEAIWFSIASLTTVGFGDYSPKTPIGMAFGALCTVAGVLMIDLPMPIIVENFANYYNHLQAHNKFPKKLRRRLAAANDPHHQPNLNRTFSLTRPAYLFSFSTSSTKSGASQAQLNESMSGTLTRGNTNDSVINRRRMARNRNSESVEKEPKLLE